MYYAEKNFRKCLFNLYNLKYDSDLKKNRLHFIVTYWFLCQKPITSKTKENREKNGKFYCPGRRMNKKIRGFYL